MNESKSMSKPNEEKANFARINRLLQRAAIPAVRHEFDKQFHPSVLKSTLNKSRIRLEKLRKQRVINHYQWTLLYPNKRAPSSSDFDLTLMMCLLINLTDIYESEVFPWETDTSEAAHLIRLKYYRNAIVHRKELTLSNKDFTKYWAHITDAICKLGGENYRKTCMQLKCTSLDESEKDIHLEIKKISKGIREHNKEEYLYWIEDTERYFPISAAIKQITEAFDKCKHHFVVVSGKPGTGKTALARYVALNLHKNNDVFIVPANNPDIINKLLALRSLNNVTIHPVKIKNLPVQNDRHGKKKQKLTIAPDIEKIQNNQANKVRVLALDDSHSSQTTEIKTIFVIDDFLGRNTINKRVTNAWKQLFYEHFYCPRNATDSIYILVTCREELRKSDQFKSLKTLYQFSEYNVSSDLRETIDQKLDIASCYMNPETTQLLFAETNIQKVDRFHTLCLLYSQLHHIENVNFFTDPYSVFEQEFEEIRHLSEPCYIGLALLTIFDGQLSKPLYDQHIDKLVRELCVECELLQNDMKLSKIQKDINMVVGRYIIDEGTSYYVVHPELYDILLNYFIKKIPKSLINFGSNEFLQTRVALLGSIHYCYNSFTGVHPIEKQHEELFFNRLINDIIKNEFENAFRNIQVANTAYQEELIRHVRKSDEVLQILASSCLPLILSVENDFSQILDLILNLREKMNLSQEVEFERQDNYDVIDYDDRKLLNLQSSINDKEIVLMLACLYGSVLVVKLLLSLEYDINYQNSMQKAPIHLACLRGNYEVVKLLLGLQSTGINDDGDNQTLDGLECDIDIQDCYGQTALHLACRMGHTKVVYLLLKKWKCSSSKADKQGSITLLREKLSVTDNQGRLALHIAAGNGSEDMIGILFRAVSLSDCPGPGIHAEVIHENNFLCNLINAQDQNGKTFIFAACENGLTYCVQYLLKFRCCNIDIYNDRNETPVFRACQNENTELVDILVKYNADVNFKDITGRTPLHVAVESKNESMVKSILNNKNCIVNLRDKNSYSALHLAIFGKNFEIVKTLLEAECFKQCDINKPDSNRSTPLMLAISADATHIVELLIYSGCNLNKCNSEGKKAFHIACEGNCNGDIIDFFLKIKTDFDFTCWDRLGRTGLHHAVIGNNIKAIKILLKTNINLNKQDENKETALHTAYRYRNLEIVTELLKTPGCDINLSNKAGKSILHIACERNEMSVVRTLLRKNCAINAEDELGRTPLHIAMSSNFLDIFTVLVNKSDINAKYMNGWTPLHMACRQQRVAAVKLLLQTACNVNIQDNTGKTALHIAACGRESSIVNDLLEAKCNVNLCDNKGKTALSYALENHNKEVFKTFRTG